jgi:ABC-type molybdate transport system ATPase subunit
VLFVSHALADAWQMNADAIVLEAGKIEAHGPAREVLAAYRERLLEQLEADTPSEVRFRT